MSCVILQRRLFLRSVLAGRGGTEPFVEFAFIMWSKAEPIPFHLSQTFPLLGVRIIGRNRKPIDWPYWRIDGRVRYMVVRKYWAGQAPEEKIPATTPKVTC